MGRVIGNPSVSLDGFAAGPNDGRGAALRVVLRRRRSASATGYGHGVHDLTRQRRIIQQCPGAGLLDEIHIDLVPVLLGGGVRLFDGLGNAPVALERARVVEAPGVPHLQFRVVKDG